MEHDFGNVFITCTHAPSGCPCYVAITYEGGVPEEVYTEINEAIERGEEDLTGWSVIRADPPSASVYECGCHRDG